MINYIDLIDKKSNPIILQIGANDGLLGEEYGLQSLLDEMENFTLILIEPILEYYEKLIQVYGKYGNKVIYINSAITEYSGTIKMHQDGGMSKISEDGLIEVKTITWSELITNLNLVKIDLLLLDCEGYEYKILKSIDFNIIKPKIIRYEYYWVDNKIDLDNLLLNNNYIINNCIYDSTYNKIAKI